MSVLDHLIDNQHIAEAYLRGSFSYENADIYSDIDLFTVVDPEKLEDTLNSIINYLEDNYPISIFCYDNRVADYGGIGFMFLCDMPTGEPFQLDVYMALKGVKPKSPLIESPRVYGSTDYCWANDYRSDNEELPESAKEFIERYTANPDSTGKIKHLYEELMVNLFVMSKHIKRGQYSRTISDHQAAFESSVELIKVATGETTHQSSEYFADRLIAKYKGHSISAIDESVRILEGVIDSPNDYIKIESYVQLAEKIIIDVFPDIADQLHDQMKKVKSLVCTKYSNHNTNSPDKTPQVKQLTVVG